MAQKPHMTSYLLLWAKERTQWVTKELAGIQDVADFSLLHQGLDCLCSWNYEWSFTRIRSLIGVSLMLCVSTEIIGVCQDTILTVSVSILTKSMSFSPILTIVSPIWGPTTHLPFKFVFFCLFIDIIFMFVGTLDLCVCVDVISTNTICPSYLG